QGERASLAPRSAAAGDRRHDRELVARFHRRVEVLEKADVLAVDEDVDEAPHMARLVADALADAGEALVEVREDGGHVRALGLHGLGAARELPQRGWHSHLGHASISSSQFRVVRRRRQPADTSRLSRIRAYSASKSARRAGMRDDGSTASTTATS